MSTCLLKQPRCLGTWTQWEWGLPLAISFTGLPKLPFSAWALSWTQEHRLPFFFLKLFFNKKKFTASSPFISLWGLRRCLHWSVEMRQGQEMVVTVFSWRTCDSWQKPFLLSSSTSYFPFSVQVLSKMFWIYVSWHASLDTASYNES